MKNKTDFGKKAQEIYNKLQEEKRRKEFLKRANRALKQIERDFK